MFGGKLFGTMLLAAAVSVAWGDDVRERVYFQGPFDMKTVRKASFVFDCDQADLTYRQVAYFASGEGYYVVPFRLRSSGRNELTLDRNTCVREEGKVAGWGRVKSVMISFYHDEKRVPKWSVHSFKLQPVPYDSVVVTSDACAHRFPALLASCGLEPLLIGANELDESVLAPAGLVVPIGGKTPMPETATAAIQAFKARGGGVLTCDDRLAAREDVEKLTQAVERCQPRFAAKMAAWREKVRERVEANRQAAQEFPAFLQAGGDDEMRVLFCHTAYGPERVADAAKWEDWDACGAWMKRMGFNAVCVNVCRGGIAFYRSSVLPMSPEVETKGDSIDLIKRACEKHGLKFLAWKVCFRSRVGMKTPTFEKWIADGRGAVSFDGKSDDEWLCPVRPENRVLEVEALVELAKRRPWAISLDYIRYSSSEWCFCDACRAAFERHVGRPVADWPKGVRADAELSRRWNDFRRANITGLVHDVVRRVRAEAPGVKIHASVVRFPNGDAQSVAQDWGLWCREGLIDVIAPMDGADAPSVLESYLTVQKPERAGAALVPTLYPSTWRDPTLGAKDLMDQIRTCRAAELPGFGVFTFDGRFINMISNEKEAIK